MALIDVVKYEQEPGVIAYKFPSSDLRWGTQLVVYPGQEAYFVKGGAIYDRFTSGTYTLRSNNLPLLNHVVNLPFGGDSPFQADVWFLSLLDRLNLRWGTETPIQLEDPKYGIIVPVRAYGQWGFRICDTEKFLNKLLGNMSLFDETMLQSYFRGILLSYLSIAITRKIIEGKASLFDINLYLNDISTQCLEELRTQFQNYGVDVVIFNIISINVPENDPSIKELKKAKNLKAKLNVVGVDNYKLQRTFDVLEISAGNESGSGGTMNWGLGLGTGLSMAKEVGSMVGKAISPTSPIAPPPLPPATALYYLAANGESKGPFTYDDIKSYISSNPQATNIPAWKPGMQGWLPLSEFPEFAPAPPSNIPT